MPWSSGRPANTFSRSRSTHSPWCDATFWVGANALLRKSALDEIRIDEEERGYVVSKFIQDHTVIEDTESTVDLAFHGWTLKNYPERLAFSATPPDFGSLLIQRSRWANGGLLIVPKLVQHAVTRPLGLMVIPSFLVRLHYLTSIATGSIGMLLLLFLPVDPGLFSIWLPVLAAAYFSMYWRDLLQNGYLPGDILRVSSFNIMLPPINIVGVMKSIQQGVTGTRTPFARTPKVEGRTAAPVWAVISLWLLLGWSLLAGVVHVLEARLLFATFSLAIASGFAYAVLVFVGPRASWEDATRSIRVGFGDIVARREKPTSFGDTKQPRYVSLSWERRSSFLRRHFFPTFVCPGQTLQCSRFSPTTAANARVKVVLRTHAVSSVDRRSGDRQASSTHCKRLRLERRTKHTSVAPPTPNRSS